MAVGMTTAALAAAGMGLGGKALGTFGQFASNWQNQVYKIDQMRYQGELDSALQADKYSRELANAKALAEQQHGWDLHKYQNAVSDMIAAGLNPGAMGSGGMSAPSIATGGSAKSVMAVSQPAKDDMDKALAHVAKGHPEAVVKAYRQVTSANAKHLKASLKG